MDELLIPFTNQPQEFSISIEDRDITIFQKWNEFSNCWMVDIYDTLTNVPLIAGLPLVTGSDLLEPFPELGFKGSLVAYTDGNKFAVPTLDNLGADANIYYLTV